MDQSKVTVLDDSPDREFTETEIQEYGEFLGIDWPSEPHLIWIAREGVAAPVPEPWRPCTQNNDDVFYFNFETGESVWDHPCDEKYRRMVEDEREKVRQQAARAEAPREDSDSDAERLSGSHSAGGSKSSVSRANAAETGALGKEPDSDAESQSSSQGEGGSKSSSSRAKAAEVGALGKKPGSHAESPSGSESDAASKSSPSRAKAAEAGAERQADSDAESLSGSRSDSGVCKAKASFPLPSSLLSPSGSSKSRSLSAGLRGVPEDDDFCTSPSSSSAVEGPPRSLQRGRAAERHEDACSAESAWTRLTTKMLATPASPDARGRAGDLPGRGGPSPRGGEADESFSGCSASRLSPSAASRGGGPLPADSGPQRHQEADPGRASAAPQAVPGPAAAESATPRGLAGVGLAGAGFVGAAGPAGAAAPSGGAAAPQQRDDAAADASASLESLSRGSARGDPGAAPVGPRRRGLDHYAASASAASEISEDLLTPSSSMADVKDRRASAGAADTLEFSVSASDLRGLSPSRPADEGAASPRNAAALGAAALAATPVPAAAAAAASPAPADVGAVSPKCRLEARLASLTRCLEMMRDIRVKQEQRLRLLQGRAV